MYTFEAVQTMLDVLIADLPPAIFKDLNCGVALTRETPVDEDGFLILGEYHHQPHGLGRYVNIHYGAMMEACGDWPEAEFFAELKETLHHELTHHLEDLAGDDTLGLLDDLEREAFLDT